MSNIVYFPGLNGLRFFSSIAVFITHVELMKGKLGYSNYWSSTLIHNLGVIGVSFFFVLSGFLITFLMLTEKKRFNNFSIKNFYIRRILRIWPLYFLLIFLGFFVLPHFTFIPFFSDHLQSHYVINLVLYLLMIPNFAISIFAAVPLIGQSWSIGVEEQFYLLWPILFRYMKKFNLALLIKLLFFWILFKFSVLLMSFNYDYYWLLVLKNNLAMLKFENMIIGGLGALLIFEKKNTILTLVFNKIVLIISIIGIFISLYIFPNIILDGIHIIHSIFFLVIILNVSSNQNSFLKLENKYYNILGRISYGIYMYHLIIIYFVIHFLDNLNILNGTSVLLNILLYVFALTGTILISYVSYNFYEKKFLKMKLKFSKIESLS